MSIQIKDLIKRGSIGLAFGIAFYLLVSSTTQLFLFWFIPFSNQQFPFEEPILVKAIYAIAMTIAWGIHFIVNFYSRILTLFLTTIISGTLGMISFLLMGTRRGIMIFLILFTLLFLAIAFLGFYPIFSLSKSWL